MFHSLMAVNKASDLSAADSQTHMKSLPSLIFHVWKFGFSHSFPHKTLQTIW